MKALVMLVLHPFSPPKGCHVDQSRNSTAGNDCCHQPAHVAFSMNMLTLPEFNA